MWAARAAEAANEAAADAGDPFVALRNLALLVAAVVLFGMWNRYRRRKAMAAREAERTGAGPSPAARHRREADRALSEMIDLAGELAAGVTTRIQVLNELVKEADDRIAHLHDLLARARAADPSAPDPDPDPDPDASSTLASAAAPGGPATAAATPRAASAPRSELQRRVARLHREGRDLAEIAAATGLSALDIQLALALDGGGRLSPAAEARDRKKDADAP